MKKAFLLLAVVLLFVQANLRAQANALDEFGQAFVTALVKKDIAALQPLMITEDVARVTLAKTDMPAEQQVKEMEAFKEALPRMQANFEGCHQNQMTIWAEKGLETMAFVRIEKQEESKRPYVEKTDLLIFVKINGQDYVIDVDDCVRTAYGWRMTAKFSIKDIQ